MMDVQPSRTRRVERAARRAIARAKRRSAEDVTPDDLLVGALLEASRFGIAWIGEWALDVRALEDGAGGSGRDAAAGSNADAGDRPPEASAPATAYSPESVQLFERAALLARREGATSLGLSHLLAAAGEREDGLMAELRRRYGFSKVEWRAALARGGLGPTHRLTGGSVEGEVAPRDGDPPGRHEILSVDEAAEWLGVHAQTVRNYIRSGKLLAYRLAGERYIRVLRKDLLALLEQVPTEDASTDEETN